MNDGGRWHIHSISWKQCRLLLAVSTQLHWKFICMRIRVHQLGGGQKNNFHELWQHPGGVKESTIYLFSKNKSSHFHENKINFFFSLCVQNPTVQDLIVQLLCESSCLRRLMQLPVKTEVATHIWEHVADSLSAGWLTSWRALRLW